MSSPTSDTSHEAVSAGDPDEDVADDTHAVHMDGDSNVFDGAEDCIERVDERGSVAGASGHPTLVSETQLSSWIARIVDRDERALAELYDATGSRVYGLVQRILRRAQLTEEVVEDTYFQVWRQAVRFDAERGRALTWLLGMARSRAIDALRREARFGHESMGLDEAEHHADPCAAADELLSVAQGNSAVHRALKLLKPQSRQLISLAFFRGLSHEEIADQTALPLGTVKSQIRRALTTLREALGDPEGRALAAPLASQPAASPVCDAALKQRTP